MTKREAIEALKTYPTDLSAVPAQAVTEMNFRRALPMATEALEKQEKYRWHDLRKNPTDFPKVLECGYSEAVEVVDEEHTYDTGVFGGCNRGFLGGLEGEFSWIEGTIIAWRYVQPFEEGDTDGK